MQVDETIPPLPVKDVIFRIHRDVRFSKDPTPYKVRLCSGPYEGHSSPGVLAAHLSTSPTSRLPGRAPAAKAHMVATSSSAMPRRPR